MKVTVKSFANIRDVLGTGELLLDVAAGTTIGGLFAVLTRRYGAAFDRQIRDQMSDDIVPFLVMINETVYRTTTDLGVSLTEGDAVTVMIPFDGG
ncbi:MAG: MoaD/ThiS family protein [Proteobacteria bacterium]|nr:MoaD/ThiS family protein [Pseudomonadota bacterium]